MKMIALACPFCSAALEVRSDYRYAECPYCGQKVLICEDESDRVDREEQRECDLLFDNAVHYLEAGDIINLDDTADQMVAEYPESPDGWFFKGCVSALVYASVNDSDYDGPDDYEFTELMRDLSSSWSRAFKYISDDDHSGDYPLCIGYSLGEISKTAPGYEEVESTVTMVNDLLFDIPETVGFMFTTEYYYMIYIGMSDIMKTTSPEDRAPDLIETIILNSLALDSDLESILYKIGDFFDLDGSVGLGIYSGEPLTALYNAVSEATDGMSEDTVESIRDSWTEDEMYDQLSEQWDALIYTEAPSGLKSMFKKSPDYDALARNYVAALQNGPSL